MTDHPSKLSLISRLSPPAAKDLESEQFQAILRSHKREGLVLAFWARTVALIFISAFLFFIIQWPVVLFPQLFLAAFFVVGWLQQRYGRVGRSRIELLLAFADIVLLTAVVITPNPLNPDDLPLPLQYHFDSFIYAFVMLAGVTLSLHWRTINLLGFGVPLIWLAAAAAVWFFFQPLPHLTALADQMFGTRTDLNDLFDPNEINWDQRVQEALVYCLVALILGLNGMRGERLLLQFAEAERKRTNLSRYFSPNVTAELVRADDALSQSRTIPVAVMFVDIVGFTRFASGVSAAEAMETLRSFFARMERAVFAHTERWTSIWATGSWRPSARRCPAPTAPSMPCAAGPPCRARSRTGTGKGHSAACHPSASASACISARWPSATSATAASSSR